METLGLRNFQQTLCLHYKQGKKFHGHAEN